MEKNEKDTQLMIGLQHLIMTKKRLDDLYIYGLVSKEDWLWHRKTIEEIRSIEVEKLLKEMEENGNEAGNKISE
ncbi:MAG: hypothetical protein M0R48_11760 [Candidatus Omnitrophica bacterium]|nr:hypothetical protein [Candidatus Omnitrophota bacterium]